ncbi:zinc finger CCCH domain-containing protein 25-like isoform X2 [Hibiscus syriacus]|uniref:zinc finger CCCH domain-containing protein 25-like isoform X2 n=1 Tax=Hibiscus syriacus TaxID=106335 RepID=UPI001921F56B|nr:zinc finger CCCH domain-containing protein 25-like isoform X2 [Hibiscus syriacus]
MNPLTLVKRLQNITAKEADLGISEEASWHAKYKDSAYIFVGGLPYDLTEGDLLAVFAQYGEVVDVNLVRDKGTGKSKGFAFLAYEDQRSTILAVDNLNGAQTLGRIIRVDHAEKYKKKEEEDEEEEQKKREARGVCYAFQRGECTRGAGCKFSHDEQRAANTGWGHQDKSSRWGNDKFEGSKKSEKSYGVQERAIQEGFRSARGDEKASEKIDGREGKRSRRYDGKYVGPTSREDYNGSEDRRSRRHNDDDRYKREDKRSRRHNDGDHQPRSVEDRHRKDEKSSRRHGDDGEYEARIKEDRRDGSRSKRHGDDEFEPRPNGDHDKRGEKRFSRNESESYPREDHDKRGDEEWSSYNRNSSSHRQGERSYHEDHAREKKNYMLRCL